MTTASSPRFSPLRRFPRWLLILAAILLLAGGAVVAALLLRQTQSSAAVWLRISPAAAPLDETTAILITSGGWRTGEGVAVCVKAGYDQSCDEAAAVKVASADAQGFVQTTIDAGEVPAVTESTFTVYGLRTGREASRAFRVLKERGGAVIATAPTRPAAGDKPAPGATTDQATPLAGQGWDAEYFANTDLAGTPLVTRTEPELNWNWGSNGPDPALPTDGFSARWQRSLTFAAGSYRFQLQANGGVRLRVDGALVMDRWQDTGVMQNDQATVGLSAGAHVIELEYMDQTGDAAVTLRWDAVDSFTNWRGEYFTNPDLAGEPALVRDDPDPTVNWGDASPDPAIPADNFSARWTRTIPFEAGQYQFILTADDGGRLYLDNDLIIDAWQGSAGQTRSIERTLNGGAHSVRVELRDLAGPASIAVGWSPVIGTTPAAVAGTTATLPGSSIPLPTAAIPTSTPVPGATPTPTGTATPLGAATPTPTATATALGAATATPINGANTTATAVTTQTTVPAGNTATAVPGAATNTPTPTATGVATTAPTVVTTVTPSGSRQIFLEINPSVGAPGAQITITSANWSPGTVVRVALAEYGKPYTQATDLPGVSFTTPLDSSQSWSFRFTFPNEAPWSTQVYPVQVFVHNAGWTEWGQDMYDVEVP